jgi:hypothetical protein
MGCVSTSNRMICNPPYDIMKPTEYGTITLEEDAVCGFSTILLWGAGITLGYVLAEKFTTMLR